MSVPVVRHTLPYPDGFEPTVERPITLIARDLDRRDSMLPHRHAWGQLTHALDGVLRVTAAGSTWIVPPSRAVWIAPGVEHAVTVMQAIRLRPVRILAERAPFPDEACRVLEVSTLLRELILGLEQLPPLAPSPRAALLSELMLDEMARCETRPIRVPLPRDKRLQSLCARLIEAPGAPLTLADWARQAGASERTLARLFERELGMSFGQWRQQVRLAHAAPMIAGGMPLARVAEELGYASQSAFSQMFRKTFGTTPSAFFSER
ncbi:helix-turn-helix transcriptional regulator [Pseudoduganella albidiflava]|uniref:AraC family transcriptional regulator n=1 Tax=Pseudoduganella albidiflava TaxID=321983 RepID=A0A411WVV4_9BURK|nr:helix-turn-helix transcriptional regulator [Pseudoduganella albidiflava]QBI00732.1 AraC family transcriptional regulator [Pseudoduganella albidiflava]GGY31068.1 AraC family transcriptional regulator [Pseudoduganella albidiflava]